MIHKYYKRQEKKTYSTTNNFVYWVFYCIRNWTHLQQQKKILINERISNLCLKQTIFF